MLITGAAFCAPLQAQQYFGLEVGTRVRVSIATEARQWPIFGSRPERLEGTVRSISADTLSLALSPAIAPIGIPLSSIRELEVSLGPNPRGHALLGGAIGGSIFGLRMYVVNQEPKTHHFASNWQAAAVGGALGFAFGAWMGSQVPNERWRSVHP